MLGSKILSLDISCNLMRPGVQLCTGLYKSNVISFLYDNHVRKIFSLLQTLGIMKKKSKNTNRRTIRRKKLK